MNRKNDDDAAEQSPQGHSSTAPMPAEPADVDALLSDSLKAQTERDFAWKEPERRPRWWERSEAQRPDGPAHESAAATASAAGPVSLSPSRHGQGVRMSSLIFAVVCLVLAAWVVASVVFGLSVDPLLVGLVLCSVAGLALVLAGLRPKPGTRI